MLIDDEFILVRGRVNIGFIKDEDEWYMIDSGLDDDQARRAINSVKDYVSVIKALLNTHSHADHIGGNSYVYKRLGIPIYSSKIEASIGRSPILEPIMLYGGYPIREMKNKFLMAKPSPIAPIEELDNDNFKIDIIDLKGHSPSMIGFKSNKIIYVADAYLDENLIRKHKLPYNYNPKDALNSLYLLRDMIDDGYTFIPSHGEPDERPESQIRLNIEIILKIKNLLESYLVSERFLDDIISYIYRSLELNISELSLHYLYKSAIKGYLTWLYNDDLIDIQVINGKEIYKIKRR